MTAEERPPVVLLVDDDDARLDALSEAIQLRMESARVETCSSARAALDRVRSGDYDCIISDIKMPGMDGLQLLAKLKDNAPEIPTMLITGHGETDLAIQTIR